MSRVAMHVPCQGQHLGICAYDIPTQDKIPVIRTLLAVSGDGLALDVGSGTGYTTSCVFGDRPTVCVDIHAPNLHHHRRRAMSIPDAREPLCVVARAAALPFKSGVFRFGLCSEVLEHLEHDDAAVRELARVLTRDGRVVITVPYTGLGFTNFLELCRIKTVHDFPGPEQHVRPGYDERSLSRLLAKHGLEVERRAYYLRFFTRLVTDVVSFVHLLYQRIVYHRRAWNWSDAAASEDRPAFCLYLRVFPILRAFSRLDRLLNRMRGFGLVVVVRKRAADSSRREFRVDPASKLRYPIS